MNIDPKLFDIKMVKNSFDQATFGVGQIMTYAPVGSSKHIKCFDAMLNGIQNAIRYGWKIHHGIGKFACNALVTVANNDDVDEDIRKRVLGILLNELSVWLMDDRELGFPEEGHDSIGEVCGCKCSRPSAAATCFIERLYAKANKVVDSYLVEHPNLELIVFNTIRVIRLGQGNPFALTHILQVPELAKKIYYMRRSETQLYEAMNIALEKSAQDLQLLRKDPLDKIFEKTWGLAKHGTVADLALGCVIFVLLNTDDYFQADQAIRCVYKFSNVTKKRTEEDKTKEEEDGTSKTEEKMTKGEDDDEFKPWYQRRWTLEGIDRVFTHPLSVPLIEQLASCASYLPFAVRILDNCATTSCGKRLLKSLLQTHMREEEDEKESRVDRSKRSANTNAHRWIDEVFSKCVKSLVDDESMSPFTSDTTLYSNISKYSDMSLALRKGKLEQEKKLKKKDRTRSWTLLCRNVAFVLRGLTAASVGELTFKTSVNFKARSEVKFDWSVRSGISSFVERILEDEKDGILEDEKDGILEDEKDEKEDENETEKQTTWPNQNLFKDSVVAWGTYISVSLLVTLEHTVT